MLQELKNPGGNAFMEREALTAIWFVVVLVTGARTRFGEEIMAVLLEVWTVEALPSASAFEIVWELSQLQSEANGTEL